MTAVAAFDSEVIGIFIFLNFHFFLFFSISLFFNQHALFCNVKEKKSRK